MCKPQYILDFMVAYEYSVIISNTTLIIKMASSLTVTGKVYHVRITKSHLSLNFSWGFMYDFPSSWKKSACKSTDFFFHRSHGPTWFFLNGRQKLYWNFIRRRKEKRAYNQLNSRQKKITTPLYWENKIMSSISSERNKLH